MFKINSAVKEPVRRLFTGGFSQMGAVTRDIDRRTYNVLQNNIDYYAEKIPEIKQFAKEIKTLNPKDLGTICDTLELSEYHAMLTSVEAAVDKAYTKSLKEKLIPQMVKASKENPESMDLVNAVINNTDSTTSKYALYAMSGGILNNKELARQMNATSKIIPEIAKETLTGGYTMDLRKQERFMDLVKSFVQPDAQPDMIKFLFQKLVPFTEKRPEQFSIDVIDFVNSKADVEDVSARLKMLPQFLENICEKFKDFDIVKFLTKEN